ncbi:hypothetical protein A1D22_00825 [Pasteurellaceae bacterium LFhippo2]|nr:hypothetical protein [Pasteurellaceae bacterium LFhippo2]
MKLQVKEWGNSKAVRLPHQFLAELGMETGDFFELSDMNTDENSVVFVVRKQTVSNKRKRLSLDERLANANDDFPILDEWDTMPTVGKEL